MRRFVVFGLGMLVACSGDSSNDGDNPTGATCDALRTSALSTVPVEEWPEGIIDFKDDVEALAGSYQAFDSCIGKDTTVSITSVAQGDIELVDTPYPAGAPCGCTQDPDFAPDANLDMTSQIPRFSIVTDVFDDPFVADEFFEMTGATYAPNEQLIFRACTTANIDPEAGSLYRDVDVVVRLPANRVLEVDFILDPLDGSEEVTCTLDKFERLN